MLNWLKNFFGFGQPVAQAPVDSKENAPAPAPTIQISVPIPTALDVNKDGKVNEQDVVAATEKVAAKAKKNVTKAAGKVTAKATKNVKKAVDKVKG